MYHTKKRIKRKDSSRCLIGGEGQLLRDQRIFYIMSIKIKDTVYVYDDVKTHEYNLLGDSEMTTAAKVFQDFIHIEQARSNLEVINYKDEATPMKSFTLRIFKYSEENPFCYGKICTVRFTSDNEYVFTLSLDVTNLESFRDKLIEKYNKKFGTIAFAAAENNSHLENPSTDFLSIDYFV